MHCRLLSLHFKTALQDPCLHHTPRLLVSVVLALWHLLDPSLPGCHPAHLLHGQCRPGPGGDGHLPLPPVPLNRGWKWRERYVLPCIGMLRALPRVIPGVFPHTKLPLILCKGPDALVLRVPGAVGTRFAVPQDAHSPLCLPFTCFFSRTPFRTP